MKYKLVVRVEGTKTYHVDVAKYGLNDLIADYWKLDQIFNPVEDTVDETLLSLELIEEVKQ